MPFRRSHLEALVGLSALVLAAALIVVACGSNQRSELVFANANDYLKGYVWEPPYPGAGPETPAWSKTPGSVGQDATEVMDAAHREHNVLGNDYKYPDYARRPTAARQAQLWQMGGRQPELSRTGLWVGSPDKMLPPDGDYPGGTSGIPEDGYVAFETGYGQQPYHGLIAPMQEAGMMDARRMRRSLPSGNQLSIIDPGHSSFDAFHGHFNDWELGNSGATYGTWDKTKWGDIGTQPLDDFNRGKWSCTMGGDCHDRTHQAGLIDGGNQYYDNFNTGSINPNSPESIHAEYRSVGKPQLFARRH